MPAEKSQLKTSLAHLPKNKQVELEVIRDIILRYVEAEMIILFGSYATGKWVEDTYLENSTTYEYISDFDILVVTKNRMYDVSRHWEEIEKAIKRNTALTRTVIINHDIRFLNEKIKHNYYFFVDIVREGILLYDSGNFELSVPKKLSPEKRKEKAKEYFGYWFEKADSFYEGYEFYIQKENYNNAAFLLHQSTEYYYTAFLLVFTDYKPKTHDIGDLGDRASKINEDTKKVFPRQTEEEKRMFDLLKRAYVDARYNKNYRITAEELDYLAKRVLLLHELTEKLCQEEITRLKGV